MQIRNNTVNPVANSTNFKAIKGIKCYGLYKTNHSHRMNLIKSLHKNKTVMDFCNKYDVNIIFDAYKEASNIICSQISILFKNPTKKGLFSLFNGQKDRITTLGISNAFEQETALKESTSKLIDRISEEEGTLSYFVKEKDNSIQKYIENKNAKKIKKSQEKHRKEIIKQKEQKENIEFKNAVNDIINRK